MTPSPPAPSSSFRCGRALGLCAVLLLGAACTSEAVKTAESPAEIASRESKEAARDSKPPSPPVDKAQQELANGVASYENGAYKLAARQLQSALALGLEDNGKRARAHKYLAFMLCVNGRQSQCRDEFRKAIEADPAFDLTPAEAGHPTWGPVFRKLKAAGKPVGKPAKK